MMRLDFNNLSYSQRLLAVFTSGPYLARRQGFGCTIDLFCLPGNYFAECFYHTVTEQLLLVSSRTSRYSYAPYLAAIELPADSS